MKDNEQSRKKNIRRFLLVSTILSFFLICVALIALREHPVTGYEISIYSGTPWIFWLAVLLGIINGIFLLYFFYGHKKKYCALGLCQIILCNSLIIALFALRGFFYLERYDSLAYIGYTKDLIMQGFIPHYNFYPMTSILLSSISQLTGTSIIEVLDFLPATILALYIFSFFVWSKSISSDPIFVTSMTLASMPIFYAWFIPSIYNESLCILLLPFFFLCLQKGKNGDHRFKSISSILMILMILWHPLVAVAGIIFLIIIFMVEIKKINTERAVSGSFILFACVAFFGWIAINYSLTHDLKSIVSQMFGYLNSSSTLAVLEGQASSLGLSSLLQTLLIPALSQIVFYILSFWALLIIVRRKLLKDHIMTIPLACFFTGSIFLGMMMITSFVHNPFRLLFLNFNIVFAVPLVGFLLFRQRRLGKKVISNVIVLLIILSIVTSVFSIYRDPLNTSPNISVTLAEISGENWLVHKVNETYNITTVATDPYRYEELIYGHLYMLTHRGLFDREDTAPNHFTSLTNGNFSSNGFYLSITSFDVESYTTIWKNTNRFTTTDFNSLAYSDSINKIFENGGIRCFVSD